MQICPRTGFIRRAFTRQVISVKGECLSLKFDELGFEYRFDRGTLTFPSFEKHLLEEKLFQLETILELYTSDDISYMNTVIFYLFSNSIALNSPAIAEGDNNSVSIHWK